MKLALRKLLQFFLTLFLISTVLFFLLRSLPGGPFDDEVVLAPEIKAQVENHYHLRDPLLTQYASYMGGLFTGDLGESYRFQEVKVSSILRDTLPATFALGGMAFLLSYFIGIFLGILAAGRSVFISQIILGFSQIGSSVPTFLAAPILISIFSFYFDLLPPALWNGSTYWILPVVALSLRPLSLIIRLVRTSAVENLQTDYIKSARAKGLTENHVLYKHVLKNSLIPLLSISGSLLAQILSGSFIVEQIFAVPGVAKHFVESVGNRDYSLLIGLTLVYSILLVAGNMFFDILAAVIDPRISVENKTDDSRVISL